jgi:hypothetical protein
VQAYLHTNAHAEKIDLVAHVHKHTRTHAYTHAHTSTHTKQIRTLIDTPVVLHKKDPISKAPKNHLAKVASLYNKQHSFKWKYRDLSILKQYLNYYKISITRLTHVILREKKKNLKKKK